MKPQLLDSKNQELQIQYIKIDENENYDVKYSYKLPSLLEQRSEKGKLEFLLGRLCAQLDLDNQYQIDREETGKPLFPSGVKGSISHSKDFAIAAVTKSTKTLSLGIDIERIVLEDKLHVVTKGTLSEVEINYLNTFPKNEQLIVATIMFSAKETLYKLINPLAGVYINFSEGIIKDINLQEMSFCIQLCSEKEELRKYLGYYSGEVFKLEDNIITLAELFI